MARPGRACPNRRHRGADRLHDAGRPFGKWLLARRAGRYVVLCDVYDYHTDEPGPDIPDRCDSDSRVADVRTDRERVTVRLQTGGTVSVPLWWFPRLCAATPGERDRWETSSDGTVSAGPPGTGSPGRASRRAAGIGH